MSESVFDQASGLCVGVGAQTRRKATDNELAHQLDPPAFAEKLPALGFGVEALIAAIGNYLDMLNLQPRVPTVLREPNAERADHSFLVSDYGRIVPPVAAQDTTKSSQLAGRPFQASLVASDTSIEAALQPVKLFERICKGGCDVGGRFAVQPLGLD